MDCPDENTLLAYCERALEPSQAQAVEAHVDRCSACLALVGEAARGAARTTLMDASGEKPGTDKPATAPSSSPGRGTQLGRYVVLDRVGAGGMGVVLSAYDPRLDRRVALKLVRALDGDGARELEQRLLREAQAVARLSHPHVITVFDVGTVDGRLFMAMEFVEGPTLRQWLKASPRSWREVLHLFKQAGQGLAAAHAAQLIHRDFKPDNVLVDGQGRARVTDFGLARLQDTTPALPTPPRANVPDDDAAPLTRTGSLVGTPAYMPPEQWSGEPMDARGDQFSFCVALYEALFRIRPFARGQPPDFEHLQAPAHDTDVPAWVRRVVLRGLGIKPADRYASMTALLEDLGKDPARRRARLLATGCAVAGVSALALLPWLRAEPAPCTGAAARLAPVWSAPREARVRAAMLATGASLAGSTMDAVSRHLSDYARAWEAGYTETCEATHVRHEQPENVLALRMACLESRRQSLDVLADTLERADSALVQKAAEASLRLPSVSDCSRVESILSLAPEPQDPAVRARMEQARLRLSRAQVLLETGRYAQGKTEATAALEEARALGYRPLEAEVLHVAGWLEHRLARNEEAERSWTEAVRAALAGRHDVLALRATTDLVFVIGYELEDMKRGLEHAAQARALMERVGSADESAARLENNLGLVYFGEGQLPQSLEHYQRALALRERTLGPEHLDTAKVLTNLALVRTRQGSPLDAVSLYERALAIQRRELGAGHPLVANTLILLGDARRWVEGPEAAVAFYEQALALREATLGETHLDTIRLHNDLGRLHEQLERFDSARVHHEKALALTAHAFGEEHAEYAQSLLALASLENRQGHFAAALKGYDRTLALQARLLGAKDSSTLRTREERAAVLRKAGRPREALAELEEVLARKEADGGPRQPRLVTSLVELARTWLELKQPERARVAAQRALDIIQPLGWSPTRRAELQFTLAQALWDAKSSRGQALALVDEALAAFTSAGKAKQAQAREVALWKQAHSRP
ncbi:tetratricopeptide repeat protein [Myxococcus sp. CA033]|uniref:serine/threonine-protein kinase n=1 Tax=Myxococcus sp. CA033 TaxID=2741516 RepID=UPI00157BA292|nr:serine/threonine-protein kinase [Myxococcus sp. CA033]NTX36270.1 tetratricopeptide repeat protein [Myxococcus sp. CA033]